MKLAYLIICAFALAILDVSFFPGVTTNVISLHLILATGLSLIFLDRPKNAYVLTLISGVILEWLGIQTYGLTLVSLTASLSLVYLVRSRTITHRSKVSTMLLAFAASTFFEILNVFSSIALGFWSASSFNILTFIFNIIANVLLLFGMLYLTSFFRNAISKIFVSFSTNR